MDMPGSNVLIDWQSCCRLKLYFLSLSLNPILFSASLGYPRSLLSFFLYLFFLFFQPLLSQRFLAALSSWTLGPSQNYRHPKHRKICGWCVKREQNRDLLLFRNLWFYKIFISTRETKPRTSRGSSKIIIRVLATALPTTIEYGQTWLP